MANIKAIGGLAIASVKSVNALAKASVKAVGELLAAVPIATAADTFDLADANPISNPASDGTSEWTSGQGRFNAIRIVGNLCQGVGTPSGGVINNVTFSQKQRVSIVLSTTVGVGLAFRASTSNADCYFLYLASTTSLQFYRARESGTALTTIGAAIAITAVGAGDTIMVEADGNSFQAYRNGVAVGTARSDGEASPYSSGSVGLYMGSATSVVASFSATDF
jgi:hypothetical protein